MTRITQVNSTTTTLHLIVTLDQIPWINNGKTCSVHNATCAGRHLSKAGNQSWPLIYCHHNITTKDYIEKLPQKITRDDHTIAEVEWQTSYLHFLHFPSMKTTHQSAHVVKKWLKRFEMYLAAHDVKDATRKRALLVKRSATSLKRF